MQNNFQEIPSNVHFKVSPKSETPKNSKTFHNFTPTFFTKIFLTYPKKLKKILPMCAKLACMCLCEKLFFAINLIFAMFCRCGNFYWKTPALCCFLVVSVVFFIVFNAFCRISPDFSDLQCFSTQFVVLFFFSRNIIFGGFGREILQELFLCLFFQIMLSL